MTYRMLLPLDGSSRAERAIPSVDRLARDLRAEVELLRVVDPDDIFSTSAGALDPELPEASARLAEDYLRDATRRFRGVTPTAARVVQGAASTMIAQQASSRHFDLIVMASHGYTGLESALLGSVAQAVVRESTVPVLVIRARVALPGNYRGLMVMVPLDGSALAEAVLVPLLPLAQALDWRLMFFWVAGRPATQFPARQAAASADRQAPLGRLELIAYLEQLAGKVRANGVRTDVSIGDGDRGASIVKRAEDGEVGLVAMSTHGRHGVGRLILGSVTEHVIKHANKPVLTIRPRAIPGGCSDLDVLDEPRELVPHCPPKGCGEGGAGQQGTSTNLGSGARTMDEGAQR